MHGGESRTSSNALSCTILLRARRHAPRHMVIVTTTQMRKKSSFRYRPDVADDCYLPICPVHRFGTYTPHNLCSRAQLNALHYFFLRFSRPSNNVAPFVVDKLVFGMTDCMTDNDVRQHDHRNGHPQDHGRIPLDRRCGLVWLRVPDVRSCVSTVLWEALRII